MASTTVIAPTRPVASRMASTSAMRPSADWTALHATTLVDGDTASASDSSGTARTVTPRAVWTRKGYSTDVKSHSGTTTSASSGRHEATAPKKPDADDPAATVSASTPTNAANDRRAWSAASFHSRQLADPSAQSSSTRCPSSTVAVGGSPYVAVSR